MHLLNSVLFDPIAVSLGPLDIRWYGICYLVGLFLAWSWAKKCINNGSFSVTIEHLDGFITWGLCGVIIGGRLGYCILYHPLYFIHHPIEVFSLWEGGMAFHGGLLGVIVATIFFTRRYQLSTLRFFDLLSLCTPLGLLVGRIGNFLNAEHFGRITTVPWGLLFPGGGPFLRHPSQLYESFLEGLLLFLILNVLSATYQKITETPGVLGSMFMTGYSLMRMVGECFREPEPHLDFFPFGLTYGQALSMIQMIVGGGLMCYFFCKDAS